MLEWRTVPCREYGWGSNLLILYPTGCSRLEYGIVVCDGEVDVVEVVGLLEVLHHGGVEGDEDSFTVEFGAGSRSLR